MPGPVILAAIAGRDLEKVARTMAGCVGIPIGFIVTAIVVARPLWWDEAHLKEWAGHAGVIVGGLIVVVGLVLVHAAIGARETDERS